MRFYQYPELEDLMESLSDEAILAVCENAMNKIKNLDANPPVEALLGSTGTLKTCENELQRRGKADLLYDLVKHYRP